MSAPLRSPIFDEGMTVVEVGPATWRSPEPAPEAPREKRTERAFVQVISPRDRKPATAT
jgi:hypothetical protein